MLSPRCALDSTRLLAQHFPLAVSVLYALVGGPVWPAHFIVSTPGAVKACNSKLFTQKKRESAQRSIKSMEQTT
jgi:hypothetical protein